MMPRPAVVLNPRTCPRHRPAQQLILEAQLPGGPQRVRMNNGAVPGTSSAYMSTCHNVHVPANADIVILEYAVNDEEMPMPHMNNAVRKAGEGGGQGWDGALGWGEVGCRGGGGYMRGCSRDGPPVCVSAWPCRSLAKQGCDAVSNTAVRRCGGPSSG